MKKYLITFFLFMIFSFKNNSLASENISIKEKINNLVKIVNENQSADSREDRIENEVFRLMNYNIFFIKVLKDKNGGFWSSLSEVERSEIKKKYNSKYVKNYFNMITVCKPLKVNLDDGRIVGKKITKFEGSYTCSDNMSSKKTLGIISAQDKIIDITINGASFIKNEGDSFLEIIEKNDDEKKKFLLAGK